jgi:hypothetical protein
MTVILKDVEAVTLTKTAQPKKENNKFQEPKGLIDASICRSLTTVAK